MFPPTASAAAYSEAVGTSGGCITGLQIPSFNKYPALLNYKYKITNFPHLKVFPR